MGGLVYELLLLLCRVRERCTARQVTVTDIV